MDADPERSRALIGAVIEDFAQIAGALLQTATDQNMGSLVRSGYGVEPEGFYAEAMRLLEVRLRSIGFTEE